MDIPLLQKLTGGVQLFDSFANAFADISQSNFIAQQFQMNEKLAGIQSEEALNQGREEQTVSQERTSQLSGSQKAAEAASGVDVNSGTPEITRQQTGEIGGLDYLTLGNNAFMKSLGYQIQGENMGTQAELEKNAGITKASNALLGGGEELYQTQLKAIAYDQFPPGAN